MASSKYITIFIFGILSTLMTQPHGGGGPGAGAVMVSDNIINFLINSNPSIS